MDLAGKDVIFIETVGVGQSEVDVIKAADTTLVVLVPGLGDDIQAIKAGILEIADVFAINKADRDGVDRLNTEIEMMLDLNQTMVDWRPPVKRTVASKGEGINELIEVIEEHISHLKVSGQLAVRRTERTKNELLALLDEQIGRYVLKHITTGTSFDALVASVEKREKDPYTVVNDLLRQVLR